MALLPTFVCLFCQSSLVIVCSFYQYLRKVEFGFRQDVQYGNQDGFRNFFFFLLYSTVAVTAVMSQTNLTSDLCFPRLLSRWPSFIRFFDSNFITDFFHIPYIVNYPIICQLFVNFSYMNYYSVSA